MQPRVVLVYDRQSFIDEAVPALEAAGFEVAVYNDPTIALDLLEKAASVDLVITKPRFPSGIQNGLSFALVLKTKRPDIKVLFLARAEYIDAVRDAGDHLEFPTTIPQLMAKVRAITGMPDADQAS